MGRFIWGIGILCMIFAGGQLFAAEAGKEGDKPGPLKKQGPDIVLAGKVFCALRRQVVMPFRGTVVSSHAREGKRVRKGEVLVVYRLWPQTALDLRRRVSSFHISDLEMALADLEKKLSDLEDRQRKVSKLAGEVRLAKTDKNLANLKERKKELENLLKSNLAPANSLDQVNRELMFQTKNRALIQESLSLERSLLKRQVKLLLEKKKLMEKRLRLERSLAKEDRGVVEDLLGESVRHGYVPKEASLRAPINGYVIWISPDFKVGAELGRGTPVFRIGVMNPVLIRANVHEIEAVQLNVGDLAEFSTQAIPGRKFEAKVIRISWSTLNPQLDQPSYYEVELEVSNPDLALREGLRGWVVFRRKAK